jgi:hypothetical protein
MKLYIVSLLLALLNGGLSYLLTENLYIALGVIIVFLLVLFFLEVPLLKRYESQERKRHEAYNFVNNFIISLSVTSSPINALTAAQEGIDVKGELFHVLSSLEGGGVEMKLHYLENYFSVSYYPMFISIFTLYEEQGGDFLKLAEPLLKEVTREEEFGNTLAKESHKRLFQYVTLWGMSSLILGFLRFGLSGFYPILITSVPFLVIASLYFVIVLLGIFLYSLAYTGLSIFPKKEVTTEGGENDEKKTDAQ